MSQWFFELYKVSEITRATLTKNSMYKLLGPDGKEISRWFLHQDLQKVDPKKLQKELQRGEYVVEEILAKKKIGGELHYLAKFVGYPEPKWVKPQKSFAEAIEKFQSKGKKQPELTENVPLKGVVKRKGRPKKVNTKKLAATVPKVVAAPSAAPKMTLSKQMELVAAEGAATANTGRVTRSRAKK
jgi:hypothetical protein